MTLIFTFAFYFQYVYNRNRNKYFSHTYMNQQYIKELNLSQYNAAVNFKGPCIIIAGAGSGKTRVLTSRIAYLLEQKVSPYTILALTFTNKAAREMRERISKLIDPEQAAKLWMGTFHSIFSRILRTESEHIGFTKNFTIYDAQDSQNLIKSLVKELSLDPKDYKPTMIYGRISKLKNNLTTPNIYANNVEYIKQDYKNRIGDFHELYQLYCNRCKTSDAMDFDDLLLYMNILLRDNTEILIKYQNKFQYILVDEYQDTNFSQYRIIKNMSALHRNICAVGDDAQSIYSFRGARIENIFNFQNDYPEHKVFKLEQNYRSTQTIVNAANSIISNNTRQLPKTIFSENETGNLIQTVAALTDIDEGFKLINKLSDDVTANNLEYSKVAILYRNNSQSRIMEDVLRKRSIPYRIYGGVTFYQRKEIKDCLSYFRMSVNPHDDQSLLRIINYPLRGLGDTTMQKIESMAMQKEVSIWTVLNSEVLDQLNIKTNTIAKIQGFIELIKSFAAIEQTVDAYDCAVHILKESGIRKELSEDNSIESQNRLMNVDELINGVRDFVATEYNQELDLVKLDQYLENVSLLTDLDPKDDNTDKVSLMTVHASKGLEFDYVYIVGLEENLFPSIMSRTEHEIEEERRLFYVALTRAKTQATLSWANQRMMHGKTYSQTVSRFVREINRKFINWGGTDNRNIFPSKPNINTHNFQGKTGINGYNFKNNNTITNNKPFFNAKQNNKLQESFVELKNLIIGQHVIHQLFGHGIVLHVEGEGANKKATIEFESGKKNLLLRFARFMLVE